MKQLLITGLLIFTLGCKKKNTTPEPTPIVNVCETKTKVFEGKYETQSDSKDTITIVFIHNNCPTEGVNTYSVYGLGKAYNNAVQSALDVNKVYQITSNEGQKSATTSNVNCTWWFNVDGKLGGNMNGLGAMYFKKL